MASKEKNLLKNTLLFSVGNVGAKLLILVIVPLYTYYVSVDQMGQYDVINTYVGLFAPLACVALHEGIYRWLLDDSSSNKDVLRSGCFLTFIFIVVFDIAAFIILSITKYPYLLEFILFVDTTCFYTVAQFTTRGLRNNRIYAVQGIVYSVVLIICNLTMVIGMRMQARGLLISMAIAYLCTTIFMVALQKLWSGYIRKGRVDKKISMDLIKYSVPIVPNNIAWWLVAASNRLVINWGMGDTANGIYAISMKFPTLVNMLSTFFYQAWQEQAITEYNSEERDAYYTKIFNMYVKLLLAGIIVLLPVTKIIIVYFMDSSYRDAYHYVGFLYLSSVFNALAAFYGTGYLSTKKTSGALITTISGAGVNIILVLVLIHSMGLNAAAIGSMLGNAIIWLARVIQTKKYFCIKINVKDLCLLLLLSFLGVILINNAGLTFMLIYELIFIVLFLFINKELVLKLLGMFWVKGSK